MNIRTILRPVALGSVVLVAGALSALGGYEAHAHAAVLTPTSQAAKANPAKVAKAEAKYHANVKPSKAWKKAGKAERGQAKRAYLAEFGSWQNGCKADLRHAYQGRTGKGGMHNVQPWLPVTRLHVPGRDIYLAEYQDGICGE